MSGEEENSRLLCREGCLAAGRVRMGEGVGGLGRKRCGSLEVAGGLGLGEDLTASSSLDSILEDVVGHFHYITNRNSRGSVEDHGLVCLLSPVFVRTN